MTKQLEDRLVIFDLDGTLIDSELKLRNDVVQTFSRLGQSISIGDVSGDWYGLASKYGISKETFDREFRNRKCWERSLEDGEVSLFPETIPALKALEEDGVRMAILSKSYQDLTWAKLAHFDIDKYFAQVVSVKPEKGATKKEGALYLVSQNNPARLENIYCVGDKVEDALIYKDISRKFKVGASGILLPNRLTGKYDSIKEDSCCDDIFFLRTPADVVLAARGEFDGY